MYYWLILYMLQYIQLMNTYKYIILFFIVSQKLGWQQEVGFPATGRDDRQHLGRVQRLQPALHQLHGQGGGHLALLYLPQPARRKLWLSSSLHALLRAPQGGHPRRHAKGNWTQQRGELYTIYFLLSFHRTGRRLPFTSRWCARLIPARACCTIAPLASCRLAPSASRVSTSQPRGISARAFWIRSCVFARSSRICSPRERTRWANN